MLNLLTIQAVHLTLLTKMNFKIFLNEMLNSGWLILKPVKIQNFDAFSLCFMLIPNIAAQMLFVDRSQFQTKNLDNCTHNNYDNQTWAFILYFQANNYGAHKHNKFVF